VQPVARCSSTRPLRRVDRTGCERHLDEMYRLQMRFRELLESRTRDMVMVMRPARLTAERSQHQASLSHVLTRDFVADVHAEHPPMAVPCTFRTVPMATFLAPRVERFQRTLR